MTVMLTCAFEGKMKDSHGMAKRRNNNGKRARVWSGMRYTDVAQHTTNKTAAQRETV
jgi:hypothetical protein